MEIAAAGDDLRLLRSIARRHLKMAEQGDMPDSKAERLVKSGPEWPEYLAHMVDARTKANKLKLHLEYLRMQERELDRSSWLRRTEQKMGRSTP